MIENKQKGVINYVFGVRNQKANLRHRQKDL